VRMICTEVFQIRPTREPVPDPSIPIFKSSDTPISGPEKTRGHSGTPDPHNHKEIA